MLSMSAPTHPSKTRRGKTFGRKIPESLLARLWKERAARQLNLKTTEGRHVRILYPGRRGTEAGPDFRDALIYREGTGLVRGDVELHLTPQDWARHGHASDHRYNGVVLHGVLDTPTSPQPLPGGGAAPAVGLKSLLDSTPNSSFGNQKNRAVLWSVLESNGYPKPSSKTEALQLLERAGRARFLGKSGAFAAFMKEMPPPEALYQALMESLGYSENRAGFLELAQRVPYESLTKATSRTLQQERPRLIQKILLESAGLDKPAEAPESADVMDRRRWRLFRIRPANHPRRRIAGAATLFHRLAAPGLVEYAVRWVHEGSFKAILQDLTVADPAGGPALIGRARALDMAVNVVFPFLHAHGLHRRDEELAHTALDLFMAGPRLQPNRITREMEDMLFPNRWRPIAAAAPRQQGLIHFHRLIQGEG